MIENNENNELLGGDTEDMRSTKKLRDFSHERHFGGGAEDMRFTKELTGLCHERHFGPQASPVSGHNFATNPNSNLDMAHASSLDEAQQSVRRSVIERLNRDTSYNRVEPLTPRTDHEYESRSRRSVWDF